MSKLFSVFWFIVTSMRLTSCWQYFTDITMVTLTNSAPQNIVTHSIYIFGDCTRMDVIFYTYAKLHHLNILGKPIIRGWLDIARIPTCIKLVGRDFPENTFRSTAHPFQMCVPRISLIFDRKRQVFFFYEWLIPATFEGGMDWTIYFFGPKRFKWW